MNTLISSININYLLMNKKFFTLLMAFAFMVTSGVLAQVPATGIDFTAGIVSAIDLPEVVTDADKGFVKTKSYYLGDTDDGSGVSTAATNFLQLTPGANPELKFEPLGSPLTLLQRRLALWTLVDIVAPEGAIAPKYIFMNEYTGVVLAYDKDKAVEFAATQDFDYRLGGDVNEWLNAPSFKNPSLQPLYYALPNDSVAALMVNTTDANKVYLAKMTKAQMTAGGNNVITVRPFKAGAKATVTLSPYELNTMLIENAEATKDSYFRMEFSDSPTMLGGENLFETDLQAVAVRQFEYQYGMADNAKGNVLQTAYASLYPHTEAMNVDLYAAADVNMTGKFDATALGNTNFKAIKEATENGFAHKASQWVALKNRDGKYLRVSHVTIDGTSQGKNNRMTFEFADLYNAKNDTRFHDPRSYLFKMDYNPVTKSMEIAAMAYVVTEAATKAPAFDVVADFYNPGTPGVPANGYSTQPKATDSKWYAEKEGLAGTNVNRIADDNTWIVKASLLNVNEVTIGTRESDPNNQFVIKLGSTNRGFAFKRTAYLLQVTASKDKNRVGKFYVKNLKGGFELVEQAPRQDFHNMPAAQWVLTAARTSAGTPVKLTNREFPVTGNWDNSVGQNAKLEGILYAGYGTNEAFFIDSRDTLAFVEVKTPRDQYLGYKYVANDTIAESTFYFKYLHELQMNRPLEIVKDSIVAVKSGEGNGVYFSLEEIMDDKYGFNGDLSSVAQLKRRVYKIYVNDASKIEDERQYITYDSDLKKYVITEERINEKEDWKSVRGALFFLKENNYADGSSYYTLIPANITRMVKARKVGSDYYATTDAADYLFGNTEDDLFVGTKGDFYNVTSGLVEKNKDIILGFSLIGDATAWIAGNSSYYVSPYKSRKVTDGTEETLYGIRVVRNEALYANMKVSVDVNTLELVHGVLSNNSANEVATSAFAVIKNDDPLYRTLGAASGETYDENVVKFYRVLHGAEKEYLYEDANSAHSTGLGLNFLGIEGKGDAAKAAMWTKYIPNANKVMPQYVIAVDIDRTPAVEGKPCPEHGWEGCEHVEFGSPEIIKGRFLINFQDSIDVNDRPARQKFQYNAQYTRLGFVPAQLIGDSLIIDNSIYTGNTKPITIGKPATWASKDTIDLTNNKHKNAVFQFRLIRTGSNDFLIESETQKGDKNVKNEGLEKPFIAPMKGGWVKVQNGVPVIANTTYSEVGMDAEIFNIDPTDEIPTSNEGIEAGEVKVIAGTGTVTIKGAAGKQVVVANILGQVVSNQVLTSDEATIAAPAGVVVVSVDGAATKALVK